jgi:hypothetical protein
LQVANILSEKPVEKAAKVDAPSVPELVPDDGDGWGADEPIDMGEIALPETAIVE